MKRTLVGVVAVVAALSAGMLPHADAATVTKLAKPGKVDPKTMLVVGGLFPQVEPHLAAGADRYQVAPHSRSEMVNEGKTANSPWGYGRVAAFFPAPEIGRAHV